MDAGGGLGDPGTGQTIRRRNACQEVLRRPDVGEGVGIVPQVEELGGRESPLGTHSRLGNGAAQYHEPVRVRVAQWIQQNLFDDGEHGDGGTETDTQAEHREHRESRCPPQAP